MTPRTERPDAPLAALLAEAERLVPGFGARMGPPEPGDLAPGRDNAPALRRLRTATAAEAPEAGPAYWTLRSWGMVIWRPALLAVLGVHRFGLLCDLESVGQSVQGAATCGCRVKGEAELGPAEALIAPAGARLRTFAEALLADFGPVAPLKPRLARRLLADRVLGLLAAPELWSTKRAAAEAVGWSTRWLLAVDLPKESRLVVIDGTPRLLRGACCLDYRRAGGGVCEGCPKRASAVRRRVAAEEAIHVQA